MLVMELLTREGETEERFAAAASAGARALSHGQYGHETQTNVSGTFVKYLESMSVITPAVREGEGGRERESGNGLKYVSIILQAGREGREYIPSKYRCRCPAQRPSRHGGDGPRIG